MKTYERAKKRILEIAEIAEEFNVMNPDLEDLINNTDYEALRVFNDHFEKIDAIRSAKLDLH